MRGEPFTPTLYGFHADFPSTWPDYGVEVLVWDGHSWGIYHLEVTENRGPVWRDDEHDDDPNLGWAVYWCELPMVAPPTISAGGS